MAARGKLIGQLLIDAGAITPNTLNKALQEQARTGRRLGEILVHKGATDETQVAKALGVQLNLAFAPAPLQAHGEALTKIRSRLAQNKKLLPLKVEGRRLTVAMADPLDTEAIDDVRFQSGCHVEAVVAAPAAVVNGITQAYGDELSALAGNPQQPSPSRAAPQSNLAPQGSLEKEASAAPVVQLVDRLLATAMERRASDIHIEAQATGSRVRMRVDGLLTVATEFPAGTHRAAISRIKIMAGLDISVRRRPQDGGFTVVKDRGELTVRVSTIPTREGEKAVLRLLDPGDAPKDLLSLGFSTSDLSRLRQFLHRRQGALLAAGPTGSGKTTTISAAVAELAGEPINIVTLEDPIEYRFPGVAQMEIDRKAEMTFPSGLRAVLRQDPDVILVGEIRDRETAEIAMSAAVTGHLVLSTIHTLDAPGAVVRLLEMGVPPFLVAGGLAGVVAQRLVRKVCTRCEGRVASACPACANGYRGRSGVFEVLLADDEIKTALISGAAVTALRTIAQRNGMGSMAKDALRQVAEGITTPHEAGRILALTEGSSIACQSCDGTMPLGAAGCPVCGRPRIAACGCGQTLERRWRFCPACLRPVGGAP